LSIKDLVFKEKPAKKLVEQYVGPYIIEEVISTNTVKLQLPTSMRIHVMRRECGQTWTRVRVKYYNY